MSKLDDALREAKVPWVAGMHVVVPNPRLPEEAALDGIVVEICAPNIPCVWWSDLRDVLGPATGARGGR